MAERSNTLKEIFYQLPKLFLLKVVHSFWFIPGLITVGSISASALLQAIDSQLSIPAKGVFQWIFTTSPVGARTLLSTIAGSTVTITGVLLSAIVVVITLASQQYGPRLVQNFVRDRIGQVVVGCFVGCFAYSVITLNAIQSGENVEVPHLAVLGALLYSIFCIGLLIFFVQHLASSIQVQSIMRRVSGSLNKEIEQLFPSELSQESGEEEEVRHPAPDKETGNSGILLKAQRSGYLQSLDKKELMQLATEHDCVVHLHVKPGNFLIHQSALAEVFTDQDVDEIREALIGCFIIGTYPTSHQDLIFPIRQLSEIAIRALSPGINDPNTAIEAIDYLSSSLAQVIRREWPASRRYDPDGKLRFTLMVPSFEDILREAFQQIHHYGQTDITVVTRLLRALSTIAASHSGATKRTGAIKSLAKEFHEKSALSMTAPNDRNRLDEAYGAYFPTANEPA